MAQKDPTTICMCPPTTESPANKPTIYTYDLYYQDAGTMNWLQFYFTIP